MRAAPHDRTLLLGPGLLAVARRELLGLTVARQRKVPEEIVVSELRLRWALERLDELYALVLGASEGAAYRHVCARAADQLLTKSRVPLTEEQLERVMSSICSTERSSFVNGNDLVLCSLDLDDLTLANMTLRFADVSLLEARRADLRGLLACSARIRSSCFEGAYFAFARFDRAKIADSDFVHADFTDSSWRDAQVEGCVFDGSRFSNGSLQRAEFRRCSFRGVHFSGRMESGGTRLAGTRFVGCDLRRTDWTGHDLTGVTFACCNMSDMSGDVDGLDAAVIEDPILATPGYLEEVRDKAEVLRRWSGESRRQVSERLS